jgi:hypothetical protein
MGDLKEEKIELIMKRDKLEEERAKRGRDNLEEDERIAKEIKELHARIEEINKKLIEAESLIE